MILLRTKTFLLLLIVTSGNYCCSCHNLRLEQTTKADSSKSQIIPEDRKLQQNNNVYWETENLGGLNYDATSGNPLRGLSGFPQSGHPSFWSESLPSSLHHYKFALDDVMVGDPDVIGAHVAFNWTILDEALRVASQFRAHTVIRFYMHYPGQPLHIPAYLLRQPYNIQTLWDGQEVVPYYGDPNLRKAMEQFIDHFGRRYDGDRRILTIQAGLIGRWGEWHTGDCTFNWKPCDPESVHEEIVQWYARYFRRTMIQVRYPRRTDAYQLGMGYHDDSFTFETVSGPANGGAYHKHFFWNMSVVHNTSDAWRRGIIGGEVRPENQNVFEDHYPAGAGYHQDFNLCADIVHATYMDWGKGFHRTGVSGTQLERAKYAHARLGYSFQLTKLAVSTSSQFGKIDINATIKQVGKAPFYYPLFLDVFCDGRKQTGRWVQGDLLTDFDATMFVSLEGIPAISSCLSELEIALGSTMMYPDRPIKWAQGLNGRVVVNIPLPPGVPDVRSDAQPEIDSYDVPFIPAAVTGPIGRCFVVCASMFCPGRRMGQDLRGLTDRDMWSISTTGNKLSVRCERNDWNVDEVIFRWPGLFHKEISEPFAINGNIGSTFVPLDFFSYTGRKTMSILAYSNGVWQGGRTIDFDLLP
jgi:hypothetical protein